MHFFLATLTVKIDFVLTNSADPVQIPHYVAKVAVSVFAVYKRLK